MSFPETVIPDTVLQPIAEALGITLDDVKDIIKGGVTPTILLNSNGYVKQDSYNMVVGGPVQNVWYNISQGWTLFHDVLVHEIGVAVADIGESIDLRIDIDGETIETYTPIALTANTNYSAFMYTRALEDVLAISFALSNGNVQNKGFPFYANPVDVYVRKTTAAGVGSLFLNMDFSVKRGKVIE